KYSTSIFHFPLKPKLQLAYNARLRGWQRITLNSTTTTETTAAHWDWKRRALTVPLEAFVICYFFLLFTGSLDFLTYSVVGGFSLLF
ncbi:hypothetical protein V5H29_17175, partial [Vibrio cholerae]|uniref:hypothetical protein n=1 Tax=Vibrio cholerae TaxID=666 RepID=UPI003967B927